MKAGRIGKAGILMLLSALFTFAFPVSYAQVSLPTMKASFNLEHDHDAAIVTLRPSVYTDESTAVDYRIRISKQGVAGTSTQSNGGRIDLSAGKMTEIGPVLRFGSFAANDSLHLELKLCRSGSRCRSAGDVLASFTSTYPDADGRNK